MVQLPIKILADELLRSSKWALTPLNRMCHRSFSVILFARNDEFHACNNFSIPPIGITSGILPISCHLEQKRLFWGFFENVACLNLNFWIFWRSISYVVVYGEYQQIVRDLNRILVWQNLGTPLLTGFPCFPMSTVSTAVIFCNYFAGYYQLHGFYRSHN